MDGGSASQPYTRHDRRLVSEWSVGLLLVLSPNISASLRLSAVLLQRDTWRKYNARMEISSSEDEGRTSAS